MMVLSWNYILLLLASLLLMSIALPVKAARVLATTTGTKEIIKKKIGEVVSPAYLPSKVFLQVRIADYKTCMHKPIQKWKLNYAGWIKPQSGNMNLTATGVRDEFGSNVSCFNLCFLYYDAGDKQVLYTTGVLHLEWNQKKNRYMGMTPARANYYFNKTCNHPDELKA